MATAANPFTAFCQRVFGFLEEAGVRHLVIGGLAVGVVGEARTTGDVDVGSAAAEREGRNRATFSGKDLVARA